MPAKRECRSHNKSRHWNVKKEVPCKKKNTFINKRRREKKIPTNENRMKFLVLLWKQWIRFTCKWNENRAKYKKMSVLLLWNVFHHRKWKKKKTQKELGAENHKPIELLRLLLLVADLYCNLYAIAWNPSARTWIPYIPRLNTSEKSSLFFSPYSLYCSKPTVFLGDDRPICISK